MLRSILAVVVGYLLMAIAIMVLFAIWFPDPDTLPSQGFMFFSLGYGLAFAAIGGYVAATIGKRPDVKIAMTLAAFTAVMGIVSIVVSAGREPLWYQIANIVVMVSGVVLGGYFRSRQIMKRKQ